MKEGTLRNLRVTWLVASGKARNRCSPSAQSGALLLFSKESQTAGSCSTLHISILPEMAPPQGVDQSPDLLSP